VTDQDGGTLSHDLLERRQYSLFGVGINAGESIVQDQDPWVSHQSPCNSCSLLLATRKGDATFANDGFKLAGKLLHIGKNLRQPGSFANRFIRSLLDTKSDVFTQGLTEQKGLLGYVGYVTAQRFERIVLDRQAID